MLKEILIKEEINIEDSKVTLLEKYMDAVIETNEKFNLTAILNKEDFIIKHILDTLLFLKYNEWKYETVADIGTGAGIPGVILGIAKPETQFTLIDSNGKKIDFINEFCKENGIDNVKAVKARSEEIDGTFDLVTSRAVASLPMLLEISSHLAKVGGELIFYKGRNIGEEMCPKLEGEIKQLGLKFEENKNYNLLDDNERHFTRYSKVGKNMDGYPRLFKDIKAKGLCK